MVAKVRNVGASIFGGLDDEVALARSERLAVDRDAYGVGIDDDLGWLNLVRFCSGHSAASVSDTDTAVTGIKVRFTSLASNSSRNRVSAECTGV